MINTNIGEIMINRNKKMIVFVCAFTMICFISCGKTNRDSKILENYVDSSALSFSVSEMTVNSDEIVKTDKGEDNADDTSSFLSITSMDITPKEERLQFLPIEEDIPESIKKVFTENAEFEVIFDMGFEVEPKEHGDIVELSIDYYTPDDFGMVGKITTDNEHYDLGEPFYTEDWKFPLHWYAYKVIDLDCDGTDELIYEIKTWDDNVAYVDYYMIFHDIEGKAYAYATDIFPFTEDGTATVGHGSIDYLYRFKSFDRDRYYVECIEYTFLKTDDANSVYVCEGKYVSREEWYEYYKENYLDKAKAEFKSKDGTIVP